MTRASMPEPSRCPWATTPLGIAYHDHEWGVPVHDDRRLFEFLVLEGAQAGLSWETILNKRDAYRLAFDGFDSRVVAASDRRRIQQLMGNAGIIRNRLKITAAILNAQKFLEVQGEFGTFDAYIWRFVGGHPRKNAWQTLKQIPARTPESDAMSKDLLRLHAGRRHGQRSPRDLLPVFRDRRHETGVTCAAARASIQ